MHTLRRGLLAVVGAALLPASAPAGLYYSGETYAELPSQWRGFLLDHRALRMVAVPRPETGPTLLRQSYLAEAERLGKKADAGTLTADEAADLGAVYVRLGQAEKAVELLRAAQRRHPEHFRIASNLGTAWQVLGDLDQAEAALRAALPLAPKELRGAEEYHLKLVQLRKRGGKEDGGPDDLFGVRYAGPQGEPAAGSIDAEQMKKLPADAVATAQRLALWLPADGRLLWQLGELANAYGDVRTAANILEGCVSEFGMSDPELRRRRQVYRAAADKLPAAAAGPGAPAAPEHERHRGRLRHLRSARPLVTKLDTARLPPIRPDGVNLLPWPVLAETKLDREFRPTFHEYLRKLDGKRVAITGFMQPLGEDLEVNYFLCLEYPVGCWFCETPDVTAMLFAELPPGDTLVLKRGLVKVEGKLVLNRDDPEDFLFTLKDARVREAD